MNRKSAKGGKGSVYHGGRMRRLVSPWRDRITRNRNALSGAEGRPAVKEGTTIGMDLGDKTHEVCVLDEAGTVMKRKQIANTKVAVVKFFTPYAGALVAMETGTHSPWIARELEALGCKVLVGNARKLRAIWTAKDKSDVHDAEMLARIARLDRKLLYPVHHRGKARKHGGEGNGRSARIRDETRVGVAVRFAFHRPIPDLGGRLFLEDGWRELRACGSAVLTLASIKAAASLPHSEGGLCPRGELRARGWRG